MKIKTKVSMLAKRPLAFKRLTGITPEQFDSICVQLQPAYNVSNLKRLNCRKRKNAIGSGNQYKLELQDRLLMLLMYYRCYVTHIFLGFIFGIDDSNVGRNINPLQPLLAGIFRIPEKRIKMNEDEIMELFFDGTEQRTQRPGKGKKQRKYYSGKKKAHTLKHQVAVVKVKAVGEEGLPGKEGKLPEAKQKTKTKLRIKAVSKTFKGKIHDKKIYDESITSKPPGVTGCGDTAYLGTDLIIPHKKPKGGKLTEEQKKENKALSSKRVIVEHGIGKMKIWQILSQRFRNKRKGHALIFKNIAGLHNLRFA